MVANTESNVLIMGETGTGKETVAEMIHQNSKRSQNPLVSLNCAAIPENLIESELFGYERGAFTGADCPKNGVLQQASSGTVFLDEIGDMSLISQAKILRTLETRQVSRIGAKKSVPIDIRLVAATNQNLETMVEQGTFRKDLFFRLQVIRIDLPSLREHKEDIPVLLDHFISMYNRKFGKHIENFETEALSMLINYDWPGNIRELKNLVECAFVVSNGNSILTNDLPLSFLKKTNDTRFCRQNEREQLLSALVSTNWNKRKAAEKLNFSRMTLYRKLDLHKIFVPI